jgi:hypothetical protein
VEDSEESDLRSEMLWIRRDGSQCLGGDTEEDAKDQVFILVGDGRDLLWHCKDDVKIADFQKFGLAGPRSIAPARETDILGNAGPGSY